MDELWIALIAAGSAVLGSLVTGWLTRSAGLRQAEAAKHAGDRQADAALHIMQKTLDDQRRARIEERRRQVYGAFLEAATDFSSDRDNSEFSKQLQKALTQVVLEGPDTVVLKAIRYTRSLRELDLGNTDPAASAHTDYIDAARDALGIRSTLDG
ncbi:hypothetical protein GCM10018777_31510 [Streptomyces albogriseolus]|uniref:hypothetical protein n=1 Tax=Streptomyces TaxID=1883 RepID=UPI00167AA640|nr:hypothetical protein [Streptomyces viridodiastaticus]GHG15462.1 hypothetical protein GCM10018777_31510 [Streptomyces viridodiastaticus]